MPDIKDLTRKRSRPHCRHIKSEYLYLYNTPSRAAIDHPNSLLCPDWPLQLIYAGLLVGLIIRANWVVPRQHPLLVEFLVDYVSDHSVLSYNGSLRHDCYQRSAVFWFWHVQKLCMSEKTLWSTLGVRCVCSLCFSARCELLIAIARTSSRKLLAFSVGPTVPAPT